MAGTIKGITIEIGGDTTKLDKALSASNKQSRDLTSELKQVNKMLKFDPSNVDLLAQKQQILTEQIGATSDKLKILQQAQAQVEAQFQSGEIGADQYRAFQRELMSTEDRLNSLQATLNQTTSEIADIGSGTSTASNAMDDLTQTIDRQESELADLKSEYANVVLEQGKNSDEAQQLASKITSLNSELNENKSKMNEVQSEADQLTKSLDEAGDGAKDAEGGFTIMKGALADLASNAIQGAIGAIKDFVGSLFELSEATEEYRTMQAKLSGSAEQFGYSMDFASEKYKQLYSYVDDEQMATNAITNLMGLGLATDDVTKLTDGAIATWTAYGDSIPIESLTESMAETIKVGKVTGTLADTINWVSLSNEQYNSILGEGSEAQKAFNQVMEETGVVEDAFSSALASTNSESERARIVAELLNTTYGESKSTYDEVAGSIIDANEAQADLTEAQAELGQAIEPVNTAFTNFKAQALEAITPLVQALAQAFQDLMTWIQQNPAVMQVLTSVVIALATAFGILAGAMAIGAIIQGVTSALSFLSGAMALVTSPITLVVAGIAGLVAGFVYLWNTCDGFRNFWIGLWEIVKSAVSTAIEFITPILQTLWTVITTVWNGISTTISTVMNVIFTVISTVWNAISTVITTIITVIAVTIGTTWNIISTTISTVMNVIQTVISTVWNAISGVISTVMNAILSVIQIIWNTISSVVSTVVNTIASVISSVWNTIQSVTSSVWNAIKSAIEGPINTARSVVSSVVNGISSTVSSVWNTIKSVTSSVWNGIKSAIETPMNTAKDIVGGIIDTIKGFFNFSISWPHIPLPHFSIRPAGWSVGDLLKGSIPSLGIDWYAKGGVFSKPTIFPTASGLKGVGEAGPEAVAPISTLIGYVKNGVREAMQAMTYASPNGMMLDRQISATQRSLFSELIDLMSYYFPKLIEASKHGIYLDGRKLVGETIDEIDSRLASKYQRKARGV